MGVDEAFKQSRLDRVFNNQEWMDTWPQQDNSLLTLIPKSPQASEMDDNMY